MYFGYADGCWWLLLHTLIFRTPPSIPTHTPSVPHLFLAGLLYCSQPHCNVSLTPSLCTGRQDCLFLCPAVLSSPLLHHYPALIASDHQYVAAADVSLLNLRREHNQPHLLQFLLSTINSPLYTTKKNHLGTPLNLCSKPPLPTHPCTITKKKKKTQLLLLPKKTLSVGLGLKAYQKAIEECFGLEGHNRGLVRNEGPLPVYCLRQCSLSGF